MKSGFSLRDKYINKCNTGRPLLCNEDIHKISECMTFCPGEQGPLHRGSHSGGGGSITNAGETHALITLPRTLYTSCNCHNSPSEQVVLCRFFKSQDQGLNNAPKAPKVVREAWILKLCPPSGGRDLPLLVASPLSSHRLRKSKLGFLYEGGLKISRKHFK